LITKLQIWNPIWLELIWAPKDAVEVLAELTRDTYHHPPFNPGTRDWIRGA